MNFDWYLQIVTPMRCETYLRKKINQWSNAELDKILKDFNVNKILRLLANLHNYRNKQVLACFVFLVNI